MIPIAISQHVDEKASAQNFVRFPETESEQKSFHPMVSSMRKKN